MIIVGIGSLVPRLPFQLSVACSTGSDRKLERGFPSSFPSLAVREATESWKGSLGSRLGIDTVLLMTRQPYKYCVCLYLLQSLYSSVDDLRETKVDRDQLAVEVREVSDTYNIGFTSLILRLSSWELLIHKHPLWKATK